MAKGSNSQSGGPGRMARSGQEPTGFKLPWAPKSSVFIQCKLFFWSFDCSLDFVVCSVDLFYSITLEFSPLLGDQLGAFFLSTVSTGRQAWQFTGPGTFEDVILSFDQQFSDT